MGLMHFQTDIAANRNRRQSQFDTLTCPTRGSEIRVIKPQPKSDTMGLCLWIEQ